MEEVTDDPLNLSSYVMASFVSHSMDVKLKGPHSPTATHPLDMFNFPDFQMHDDGNPPYNTQQRNRISSLSIGTSPLPHRGSMSHVSDQAFANTTRNPNSTSSPSDFNNTSNDGMERDLSAGAADFDIHFDNLEDLSLCADASNETPSTGKENCEETMPTWSEMKTKAGKDRKRLPLACIACRRKKIRCSGEKPVCKHCLRSRIPCVYKVTTRKAAPRTDYMAMLDKRLKRMEDRVIKLIPKENQAMVTASGRSVVKPQMPTPQPKPATKKRQVDEAFGNELDEWSKSKSTNPADPSARRGQEAEEKQLLTEGADSLPSKELQEHLAEVYFDHVYGQSYALLHKPSFMRKLSAGTVPPVLILAVCAVSARFSTHPEMRSEPAFLRGESYASTAREIALRRYDSPNITILIVYLLLGLHEFGTCQGGRSWMLGGMAQRMAYALQLHRDLEYDPTESVGKEPQKLSFTDREIRRRTMWSCFLMDRFNSSGTDRPIFVSEQFIEAQLPIKEHFFQLEISGSTETLEGHTREKESNLTENSDVLSAKDNMGVMAYMIRLVAVWGKVIKYINLGGQAKDRYPIWSEDSEFRVLQQQLQKWKSHLPESLQFSKDNLETHAAEKTANHFLYLHICYHQIMLFMNRFALPSPNGPRPSEDMPRPFYQESKTHALAAARELSILIHESSDYNVTAPFAGYAAFFSSTVHVFGVFSPNPEVAADSKKYLAWNVKYLSKMKQAWGMFHFVAENLKELYRQHSDMTARGPAASAQGSAAKIFQYGDWFDQYPHGVSKTDYEDPVSAEVKREAGTDAVLGQKSDLQTVEDFFASLSTPSHSQRARKRKTAKAAKESTRRASNPIQPASRISADRPKQGQDQHPQHRALASLDTTIPDIDINLDPSLYGPTSAPAGSFHNLDPNVAFLAQNLQSIHASQHNQSSLSGYPNVGTMNHSAVPNYWNMDFSAFGGGNNMGYGALGMGGLGQGWYMPFNVEPPDLGDDGAFASGGFDDFGGGAHGFGVGMEVEENNTEGS